MLYSLDIAYGILRIIVYIYKIKNLAVHLSYIFKRTQWNFAIIIKITKTYLLLKTSKSLLISVLYWVYYTVIAESRSQVL